MDYKIKAEEFKSGYKFRIHLQNNRAQGSVLSTYVYRTKSRCINAGHRFMEKLGINPFQTKEIV